MWTELGSSRHTESKNRAIFSPAGEWIKSAGIPQKTSERLQSKKKLRDPNPSTTFRERLKKFYGRENDQYEKSDLPAPHKMIVIKQIPGLRQKICVADSDEEEKPA